MTGAPIIVKIFQPVDGDDFAAYRAAEKWLRDHGYSTGSMQRGAPTAAFIGDCDVSKWRNLDEDEQNDADAIIHDMGRGRFRGGSVEVAVYELSPQMLVAFPAPKQMQG